MHTTKNLLLRHHKYAWVFTSFAILVVLGFYVKERADLRAAPFAFLQSSWSGGGTPATAVHPTDQTGWNQFSSGSSVVAGGTVELVP